MINNQVGALSTATNLVTVTAGGNDAGFASLIVNCTFTNCVSSVNSTNTTVQATLPAKLDAMNTQIKNRAPNATVIVLGYPHLFSGTCFNALGISSSEVTAANNLADALDSVTRTEAAKFGFVYKSAIAQFTNHGVCASSAWLHGLNLTVVDSYHPTSTGHSSGLRAARALGHRLGVTTSVLGEPRSVLGQHRVDVLARLLQDLDHALDLLLGCPAR